MNKRISHARIYRLLLVFTLFQKSATFDKFIDRAEKSNGETNDYRRIRCPLCRWQPKASSRWYCSDDFSAFPLHVGCGTGWNTFDTRGRCPGCEYQWRRTDCLNCGRTSTHEDWYEKS